MWHGKKWNSFFVISKYCNIEKKTRTWYRRYIFLLPSAEKFQLAKRARFYCHFCNCLLLSPVTKMAEKKRYFSLNRSQKSYIEWLNKEIILVPRTFLNKIRIIKTCTIILSKNYGKLNFALYLLVWRF